jgi:nucleotide-binding universal stress UspA family protein
MPKSAAAVPQKAGIRHLLVPLDGSELAEAALPLVEELARRLAIPVHLVQVINYAATLASLTDGGVLPVSPSRGVRPIGRES